MPTYGPILPKHNIFIHARSLYSRLVSKVRTSTTSSARLERASESRREPGLRSRFQRYDNLSDGAVDGVVLTQAEGDFEQAEQHVAGRDFPMNAINVKSTVEMI